MSYFENRRNSKSLAAIQKHERAAGQAESIMAVLGKQRFTWSDTATVVVCVFVVAFFIALAMGYLIAPGGIFLIAGFNAVKPARSISVGNTGVRLWKHSFWGGKPSEPLATCPHSAVTVGEWTTVGSNHPVKLSDSEVQKLRAAIASTAPSPATASSTPPPPPMANAPLV